MYFVSIREPVPGVREESYEIYYRISNPKFSHQTSKSPDSAVIPSRCHQPPFGVKPRRLRGEAVERRQIRKRRKRRHHRTHLDGKRVREWYHSFEDGWAIRKKLRCYVYWAISISLFRSLVLLLNRFFRPTCSLRSSRFEHKIRVIPTRDSNGTKFTHEPIPDADVSSTVEEERHLSSNAVGGKIGNRPVERLQHNKRCKHN